MFASSAKIGDLPEVRKMRMKVLRRIAMMFIIAVFIALMALQRVNLIRLDMNGVVGSSLLIAAIGALLYIAFDRDSYLPFLGECVIPTSIIASKTPPDASFSATVDVPAGATHVMYWASESGAGTAPNPYDAYGNYANAGVVEASAAGRAILPLRCPRQYVVRGKTLPRHVHYRALYKSGIAGPVQSVEVTCA